MKPTTEQTAVGLQIAATAIPQQQTLREEFAMFAAGTCSWPTLQDDEMQSIDVQLQPAGVATDAGMRPGEEIDVADIAACLQHTTQQVGA